MNSEQTTTWEEFEENAKEYWKNHPEIARGEKEMPIEDKKAFDAVINQIWKYHPLF